MAVEARQFSRERTFGSEVRSEGSLRQVAGTVLHFAERTLGLVHGADPSEGMSEHFGRAQKRNDLDPGYATIPMPEVSQVEV